MRRHPCFIIAFIFMLGAAAALAQISEEERKRRELFLRARDRMIEQQKQAPTKSKTDMQRRWEAIKAQEAKRLQRQREKEKKAPPKKPKPKPKPRPEAKPKPKPKPPPEPKKEEKPRGPSPEELEEQRRLREQRLREEKRLRERAAKTIHSELERQQQEALARKREQQRKREEARRRERKEREKKVQQVDVRIRKQGEEKEKGLAPPPERKFRLFGGPRYRFLTGSVRRQIDKAPVKRNRWKYIIIHNSGSRNGNARIFDYYHKRVRKMRNGLAYHFVIGNGSSSGDGEIEVGKRWTRQINGGHVASDYLNNIALGICLVGDFNKDTPTKAQVVALEELTHYLRKRVGRIGGKRSKVVPHKFINPRPTDCPGDRFLYRWLKREFG